MWKYKNQTLISVIGLAVGFTCFALATLWIRYEMTFDSFHKNAKQMYVIYKPDSFSPTGYGRNTPNPLAAYLKETFPEVANAIPLTPSYPGTKVILEGMEFPALYISADSSFFRMFDVKIIEGSRDFLINNSRNIAITHEKAQQLFGNENPMGKTVNNGWQDYTICAIVSEIPKRSNYVFDFIQPFGAYAVKISGQWYSSGGENTIIELVHGVNVEAFEKKLYEHDTGEGRGNISKMTITPLTKLRYTCPDVAREVKFQHILIFALSGLLVVLCSLFNYLTLFVSRFRMRQKELALRMVCGASGRSLLAMLSVEFILMLLFAVVLGCMLTQLFHKPFLTLSEIQMELPAIYRESLMYVGGVILVSLLLFWLILFIFQSRSLNLSIRRSNKKLFRKTSVVVQLVISIGFAFCTIIILKQMYFLHHTAELGFSFQNRGAINVEKNSDVFANHLKQIPEITEVIDAKGMIGLLPQTGRMSRVIGSWDDQPADGEIINLEFMCASPEYNSFYEFRLVAGEMLTNADPDSLVLLNESAVKAFGWHDPVGKHFDNNTVKGVIKNVYNFAPTVEAKPVCYTTNSKVVSYGSATVLFKYREGMWEPCKKKIELLIEKEYPDPSRIPIYNSEKIYNNFLKSENALIKLLSLVSAICVLICVFGFVSLVSLTCEERRKSIAIRKINGATAGDILSMFAKEYFLLLVIGAAIAFPAGYLIMQRWLEQYVKQTSIPAWIYLSIICVLALVLVLCVGWQVYKASVENPAEVVKSE
jgi:ABC-type antimicrobial peptide transport system permease subunit